MAIRSPLLPCPPALLQTTPNRITLALLILTPHAAAAPGVDLFGAAAQFRSWLSCRAPHCSFDILVVRYETLNQSVPAILDFLDVPPAARPFFPTVRPAHSTATELAGGRQIEHRLQKIYGDLQEAIDQVPPTGLLLRNSQPTRSRFARAR